MYVIGGSAAFEKTTRVLAQDPSNVGIQTRPQLGNDPAVTVLGAENDMKDGTDQGLGYGS